jgi:hypothetical protein
MKRHVRPERRNDHYVQVARELIFKETGEKIDNPPHEAKVRAAQMQGRGGGFTPEEMELAAFMIANNSPA